MRREDLEHIIRAAAAIVDDDEIVVIGSQAVVVQVADPPEALLVSMEADVFPLTDPERAIEIDGVLGDGSPFHDQYGYYANGVGPETPHALAGWQGRTVRVAFSPVGAWRKEAVGQFMEMHDVVLSKLVAGHEKDFEYASTAIANRLVNVDNLRRGLPLMIDVDRALATQNLELVLASGRSAYRTTSVTRASAAPRRAPRDPRRDR